LNNLTFEQSFRAAPGRIVDARASISFDSYRFWRVDPISDQSAVPPFRSDKKSRCENGIFPSRAPRGGTSTKKLRGLTRSFSAGRQLGLKGAFAWLAALAPNL